MEKKRNNILVTGASGFVGQYLLERLIQTNCDKIVAVHNNPLKESTKIRCGDNIIWKNTNLIKDDCGELLIDIDVVFHLAGYSSIATSKDEIDTMESVNIDVTKKLAEKCLPLSVRHFIFVSSVSACEGCPSERIDETNGVPITPYGDSKKRAEDILFEIADGQYAVTILRPTALFGEYHQGSLYELVKSIKYHRFVIFGSGNNLTNFYYIRDFIELLINVKDNNKAFNQVFIASDNAFRLIILIEWIVVSLKYKYYIVKMPLWVGYLVGYIFDITSLFTKISFPFSLRRLKAMTRDVVYSNRKIKNILDIKQIYGVQQGINNTIEWYDNNGLL
jgi:UDP-glucose 4-epimerase